MQTSFACNAFENQSKYAPWNFKETLISWKSHCHFKQGLFGAIPWSTGHRIEANVDLDLRKTVTVNCLHQYCGMSHTFDKDRLSNNKFWKTWRNFPLILFWNEFIKSMQRIMNTNRNLSTGVKWKCGKVVHGVHQSWAFSKCQSGLDGKVPILSMGW